MQHDNLIETLNGELAPLLDELDAELVELKLIRQNKGFLVQVFVDKKESITIDECALINKRLGGIIDKKNLITERYLLEVSSPGLDRPLKERKDFEKVIGKDIEVWLILPVEGRRFFDAKVRRADEVAVSITDKHQEDVSIPYTSISKARLKI